MVFVCQQTVASLVASSVVVGVSAFQSSPIFSTTVTPRSSSLKVAVDPTVVTKTEYADICGVSFNDEDMAKRLERTSFLYPKHVEVIEDFAQVANEAVDQIVSKHVAQDFESFIPQHPGENFGGQHQ